MSFREVCDPRKVRKEDRSHVGALHVPGGQHERSHSRCKQRVALQGGPTDPLVLHEDHPTVLPDDRKPLLVSAIDREVLVVELDLHTRAAQGVRHVTAAERAVDEEDELLRLPGGARSESPPR